MKKGNNISVVLGIVIVVLVGVGAFLAGTLVSNKEKPTSNVSNNLLSDEDALQIGEKLYEEGIEAMHLTGFAEEMSSDKCKKLYEETLKIYKEDAKVSFLGGNFDLESNDFGKIEDRFKGDDGNWSCLVAPGRGGDIEYMNEKKLTIDKKEETKITFIKQATYCEDANFEERDDSNLNCLSTVITRDYPFIIEKENGIWKIAQISVVY